MIDDAGHDLAIEYLLGGLESEALREFEAWMHSDPELRRLVDDLRESLAAMAHAATPLIPPPALRARILGIAGTEEVPIVESVFPTASAPRFFAPLPWALAAGFAALAGVFFYQGRQSSAEARRASTELAQVRSTVQAAQDEATSAAERVLVFETQTRSQTELIAELRDQLSQLRQRDALAQVKIATLTAQVAEFGRAGAVVIWDPQEQRGVIKLANLPPAGTGKDYQLWIIDPKYPAPVNGGVVPIATDGTARFVFRPDQPVANADKFAISVERTGGVPKAEGPIIFVGN